ncbi:retrotransposon protein, putative, ty1-copia subclass [Tanacetum coccineum]
MSYPSRRHQDLYAVSRDLETEFPAIVFNDTLISELETLPKPTVISVSNLKSDSVNNDQFNNLELSSNVDDNKTKDQTVPEETPIETLNERNCPKYLAELLKNKKLSPGASGSAELLKNKKLSPGASGSGIFTIELYTFPNKSYDIGYGTHIGNTTQALSASRKLKPGASSLYVGNGQRAAVEAIGSFHLCLLSGLVIVLNNYHCAPSITRGIILVSKLYDDVFINCFVDNAISVSRNNVVYVSAIPRDGIFEIDLSNPNTNDRSMYNNSFINQEASGNLEDLEIIHEEDTHPSKNTSSHHEEDDLEIDEPLSDVNPIRRSTRTRNALNRMCLYIDAEEHELGDLGEPANYKSELLDPEYDKWLDAMNVEMQSMKDNKVWDLVDLPSNDKSVGSKWLFKKKTEMDAAVHTFKARLVAKGFTQTYRVDYEKTFSPVLDIRAIRILIAIPEGFVNPKYLNRVCKLKRSIYGLKQASRQWNKHFDDEIKKFSFTQNQDEPCVYMKASGSNVTFLILYVDDILIMGNHIPMLQGVKSYLGKCFAMKDLGEATYIIGIKIYRDKSRRLIGDLHWTIVKNILKYLRNTKDMFLVYGGTVDWNRTKQSIFATSSVEAEYIAAFDASKEAVWVRKFISRLNIVPTIKEPINMYCDNTGAIDIANESGITKGARHFRAKVHYLRKVIEYGDIKLENFHTYDNLADPFTKALAFPKHSEYTMNIGMLPASSLV